ncbi:MAG: multidrug efflux pump subunit AcrA (membrane-fusion protein) [Patiriisocius sp.]|jgi:multidrug efflux pump subunit AcrA (membrane-fusion protein)
MQQYTPLRLMKKHKIKIITVLSITTIVGYLYLRPDTAENPVASAVVVERVERGDVTSGIETTGEIVAAQKLNLDVYKQTARIDIVNAVNGGAVKAGDVLFGFDASDVLVAVQSSRVDVVEAQLTLENQQANYTDPNAKVRTLENDIVALEAAIAQAEVDKSRAYREYLNVDIATVAGNTNTEDKIRPSISGLYTADTPGEYVVSVYRSGTESGYSFQVSGLESGASPVLIGLPSDIGQSGLEITFADSLGANDTWVIAVPNTYTSEYVANREDYEETRTNLDLFVIDSQLSIVNKQQEIEDLLQNDSTQYRDLGVSQAQAALAQAREQLSQNFDVVQEQNIVASFSGTVEGMENVVVGASPTRDTNDPITLGTLISDDFLVTFSLSAVDVAKVEVGQLVLVNITSFPDTPTLEAYITEISSLPNSDGVAQYEVQALISMTEDLPITLREGLLADIEIVEEVAQDVLRIPTAAVTYKNKQAQVRVLEDVTEDQQRSIDTLSIVRNTNTQQLGYLVDVEIGVTGAFYTQVVTGLTEGQYLVVGSTDDDQSALQENGPGGRPQSGRPSNND